MKRNVLLKADQNRLQILTNWKQNIWDLRSKKLKKFWKLIAFLVVPQFIASLFKLLNARTHSYVWL